MSEDRLLLHGTSVALGDRAVLLRGASGTGKSDLAYRFLKLPTECSGEALHLIADDQVNLVRTGNVIQVSPPATIAGQLELRNIGILKMPYLAHVELGFIVDLRAQSEIARMPDWTRTEELLGLPIPVIALAPFEASAALKLHAAFKKNAELNPSADP